MDQTLAFEPAGSVTVKERLVGWWKGGARLAISLGMRSRWWWVFFAERLTHITSVSHRSNTSQVSGVGKFPSRRACRNMQLMQQTLRTKVATRTQYCE